MCVWVISPSFSLTRKILAEQKFNQKRNPFRNQLPFLYFPSFFLFILFHLVSPKVCLNQANKQYISVTMEAQYNDKSTSTQVITTTTIVKDYDANTGNKLLNDYMILREIGRGVHGKVKLAQHMGTGELVVCI